MEGVQMAVTSHHLEFVARVPLGWS